MEGLKGLDSLVKTLNELKDKASKKAARAGVNAGLTVLAKSMRSAINASSASPEMKRAARQTIGKRLKKVAGQASGKAGFAVGQKGKRGAIARAKEKHLKHGGAGVGISAANIHWPTLGTRARTTSKGHRTGAMPAVLSGVISSAVSSAGPAMLAAAAAKVQQVLAAEATKAKG